MSEKERVEGQGSAEKESAAGKRGKSRELEMSVGSLQDIMVARDSGLGFGSVGVQEGNETKLGTP